MLTNPGKKTDLNKMVIQDRKLTSISTIAVSIVGLSAIAYCWHFGIIVDINKIIDILDRIVRLLAI